MAALLGASAGISVQASLQTATCSSSNPSRSQSSSVSASSPLLSRFEGLRVSSFPANAAVSDFAAACNESLTAGRANGSRGVVSMGGLEAGVGIMGNKVGMMTWFTEDGKALPCTVIGLYEGNVVTQVKTPETDGYTAVQVGYRAVQPRKLTQPELGHVKKAFAGMDGEDEEESAFLALRHLQEFRLQSVDAFQPGQQLKVEEIFKEGDLVDISGTSIGKGFQGGIKVHNFARGAMTHGSKSHRQLGSIGAGTTPGRVYPGKKMPRQLGNAKVKVRKLQVVKVDPELCCIIVKGAVPGKRGNLVRIAPAKIVGKNIPKN